MIAASLPGNEDARLTTLREYQILDTAPEDSYDDMVRLAAFICGTPIATITLIDAERQWFKSILGLSATETPRDVGFCAHTILQPDLMTVPDALEDVRFADNPFVTGDPCIRFYAGAPLVTSDGFALGSLCVIDRVPRHLTPDQEAALRTIARQVTNQIELARRSFLQEQMLAERQQAEDALRQSTEELSAVVEQAMDGIFVFDPESRRLLKTNAPFRAMLGYSEEQAVVLTLYDLVGDDRESVDKNVRAVMRDKKVDLGERHYLRRDGSVAVLEIRARVIRYSGGEACCVLAHDMTAHHREAEERRQAAETMRQSEARLRLALESGHLGSFDLDQATGQYRSVSDIFKAQFGLPPAAAFSLHTLIKMIHPDDRLRMRDVAESAQQERRGFQAEHRVVWPDGSVHWVSTHTTPIYEEGQPSRLIGVLQDITERKEAEAALRQSQLRLVEAQRIARVGSWELDLATGERAWSEEMYRICGLDPAQGPPDEATQRACYHPDDLPLHDQAIAEMLITGHPCELDARAVRPDGEIRWCHLTAQSVLDAEGKMIRIVGTALDITERMEREQQVRDDNLTLAVQKAELEAANTELAALATTDPLTGLLNYRAFHVRLAEEAALAERGDSMAAVALLDLDGFRFFNDAYGHTIGDAVLRQVASRLQEICGTGDAVARFGGDEFTVLLLDMPLSTTPAEVEARLRAGLDGLSYQPARETAAIPISISVGAALLRQDDAGDEAGRTEAPRLAEERLRRAKTGGDVETEADRVRAHARRSLDGFSMLDALVTAVDNKDRYTRRHSEGVMEYSLIIAKELGMDFAAQDTVAVAALLHDVGKIGIPDSVLRKPGKLTDEEFETVKQHPMMGAVMVGAVPGLEKMLDAVRHHHERWDGGGYPFGLKGDETPLIARLMAVADAFSAMTTDRPYRKGMDRLKALSILAAGAGTQWDPNCVRAFLVAQEQLGPIISSKAATYELPRAA